MRLLVIILVLIILSGLVVIRLEQANAEIKIKARVTDFDLVRDAARSFEPIYREQPIIFPDDRGDHLHHQIDGWIYGGHLTDEQGNRYGFQLMFLRFGLSQGLRQGDSEWSTNQIYLTNFALTDVTGQTFTYDQRFSRGNNRLAGANRTPYRVWVEDWHVRELSQDQVQLKAANPEIALDLTIQPKKPAILPDQPVPEPADGPAIEPITYYAFPDNEAWGTVTTPRGTFTVTGESWHYHLWGNLNFGPITGWDLFWLQLDDDREIIYFHVYQQEDVFADSTQEILLADQIALVDPEGQVQFLPPEAAKLTVHNYWQSSQSKADYPAKWTLAIPDHDITLQITPLLADQEISGYLAYWGGAVDVEGTQQGHGYVELAGRSNWQVWTK